MADEQQRRVLLVLDVHQQFRDRRRHRDIECGYRLIGDYHGGIAREGAGNAHALLLPPRELARPTDIEVARQLDDIEQLEHPFTNLLRIALVGEAFDHAPDLRAHAMARIQGVEWILEDHLQCRNPIGRPFAYRLIGDLGVLEANRAPGRRLEAHQYLGESGLAATGFTDDRHCLRA